MCVRLCDTSPKVAYSKAIATMSRDKGDKGRLDVSVFLHWGTRGPCVGTKGQETGFDWETMARWEKRNYCGWIWVWGTPMTFDLCGLFRLNVQQKPKETSKSFCNLQTTNAKISSKDLNHKIKGLSFASKLNRLIRATKMAQ